MPERRTMRVDRGTGKRSGWVSAALCLLMLVAAVGPAVISNRAHHAQAAVLLSPTDPLLGVPRGTPEKVIRFAQAKKSTRIGDVRAYVSEVYRLSPLVGLDPALVIAQSALETGNWTSFYWTNYLNPAGIGIGYDGAPSYTWETGTLAAHAQIVRLYIYSAGAIDPGNPLYPYRFDGPTYQRVIDLGYNGQAHTLNDLTGRWATDPDYGQKVASRGNGVFAPAAGDPTEPAVNPVLASTSSGGDPVKLRDSDLNTAFAVLGIDSPPPGLYIDYDFGQLVTFQSIQWVFRLSEYADSYQLQTSSDGANFTTRSSYVNPTTWAWNIYGGSVTARYVRFLFQNPNQDMRLGYLSEVEFYGRYANVAATATSTPYPIPTATNTPIPTNTPTVTNTPVASATATSTATIAPTATPAMLSGTLLPIVGSGGSGTGNWTGYVRDGNIRTTWQTTSALPPRTAQVYVDLGQSLSLTGAEFMFRRVSGARSYEIRVSNDKKAWTTVATFSYAEPLVWQRAEFSASGRYVQFLFTNTNGTAALGYLAEVKVFGLSKGFGGASEPLTATITPTDVPTATSTTTPELTVTQELATPTPVMVIDDVPSPTPSGGTVATPIATDASLPIVEFRRTANSSDAGVLTDGDPATTWASTDETPTRIYVIADLGEIHDVGSVEWLAGPEGIIGEMSFAVTTDGVSWRAVDAVLTDGDVGWQRVTVNRPAGAVRIVIANPDGAPIIGGVAELRIQPSAEP
jgi:hypothetical protein